jgi:hypothetical protein
MEPIVASGVPLYTDSSPLREGRHKAMEVIALTLAELMGREA